MNTPALSVKQLNFYVKNLIEGDPRLQSVCVMGEISNLKSHYASGHIYFTLKDNDAAINCVMFRSFASVLKFTPKDGQQVIVSGRVSVYEKDGRYQFYAEQMQDAGLGDIALKFEQTREKLQKEGLFDPASKRSLPRFPKKIAVVTSPTGAAVRDILNILSRRWKLTEVLLCPVSVQGQQAVPEILAALDKLYTVEDVDVCIIGRGGGSIEDLWAFNDESLAYKIYEAPFPVISAVGHETDFTICDFVADLRAPTPSAAAELAVPDEEEISDFLKKREALLKNLLKAKYENSRLRLEKIKSNRVFSSTSEIIIGQRSEAIDRLNDKMNSAVSSRLNGFKLLLGEASARLDALSPLKTLSRGYGAISLKGKTVQTAAQLTVGDSIKIRFADGEADCTVNKIRKEVTK